MFRGCVLHHAGLWYKRGQGSHNHHAAAAQSSLGESWIDQAGLLELHGGRDMTENEKGPGHVDLLESLEFGGASLGRLLHILDANLLKGHGQQHGQTWLPE